MCGDYKHKSNMGRMVTAIEQRKIQLDMLREIDEFCHVNKIKYSLACGTLLGAIRHNGYIPWDDDVDICMPIEDLIIFKRLFISRTLEYVDIDIKKGYSYAFPRIVYKPTYSHPGIVVKSEGVCIDLYPLIEVPQDNSLLYKLLKKGLRYEHIHYILWKWNARIIKRFPVHTIPFKRLSVLKLRDFYYNTLHKKGGGCYYYISGPITELNKFRLPFNPFDCLIKVPFEGLLLQIPKRYDYVLRMWYGDYMVLPPEDQRHPYHMGNYYWEK